MIWLLYEPLNILFMLLCFFTNWFVLLFCDEEGELPRIFRMWQTWDDSCNPRFHVLEEVPSFLKYDYDKHYREYRSTNKELKALGRDRCYARVIDPDFTLKERIQRYCCRLLWLTRNCSYGFSFFLLGKLIDGKNMTILKYAADNEGHKMYFAADMSKPLWNRPWVLKSTMPINKKLRWEIFAGWKINPLEEKSKVQRMIAHRIAFRFIKRKK